MKILAIDPGTTHSAYVVLDNDQVVDYAKIENSELLSMLAMRQFTGTDYAVIEMIASYGMPVGKEVFETCVWIGRFIEASGWSGIEYAYRKDVKIHLCGTTKAKDANIRQALLDRFYPTGGGSVPQIGTKKAPGPLYGVSKDVWAALAVAVYHHDKINGNQM